MTDKIPVESTSDKRSVMEGQMFSDDGDVAAAYADKIDGENAYDRKEEKRLRWKLDMRLVSPSYVKFFI